MRGRPPPTFFRSRSAIRGTGAWLLFLGALSVAGGVALMIFDAAHDVQAYADFMKGDMTRAAIERRMAQSNQHRSRVSRYTSICLVAGMTAGLAGLCLRRIPDRPLPPPGDSQP